MFLLYVIVLLIFVSFGWIQSESPHYNGVSVSASVDEAVNSWGFSDPGSYLRAGQSLETSGGFNDQTSWVLSFWPPGMPLIYSMAIRASHSGIPFISVVQLLNALLWSIAVVLLVNSKLFAGRRLIGLTSIAILALTPEFRSFTLRQIIPYSDGLTAALLATAIILSIQQRKSQIAPSILIGVCIGCAANLRGQYFGLVQVLFFTSVLIVLLGALTRIRLSFSVVPDCVAQRKDTFKRLSLVGLFAMASCLPYLSYRLDKFGDIPWDNAGKITWTTSSSFVSMFNWMPSSQLAPFIAEGGQGTACKLDKVACEHFVESELLSPSPFNIYDDGPVSSEQYTRYMHEVMFSQPISWFKSKFPIFLKYWFSGSSVTSPVPGRFLAGLSSLVGFVVLVSLSVWHLAILRELWPVLLVGIMVFTIGPPFIAHFEVRYLLLPRLLGLGTSIMFFVAAASFLGRKFRSYVQTRVELRRSLT